MCGCPGSRGSLRAFSRHGKQAPQQADVACGGARVLEGGSKAVMLGSAVPPRGIFLDRGWSLGPLLQAGSQPLDRQGSWQV